MSRKIKDKTKDSLTQQIAKRLKQEQAERNMAVSFEHEISNANYLPDGLNDKNDRLSFYEEFRKKLRFMNGRNWKDFGKESKKAGYETIPYTGFREEIQASLKNVDIISPDSKLDIIRVANKYRIIGKFLDGVFYIMLTISVFPHIIIERRQPT